MNSVGILSAAGGLGRVMAHWITTGRPDVDVTGFNVDRFRPWQADDAYRAARTTEILGTVYAAHTPGKQLRTARNTLLSPVHDRLVDQGGFLREVSGWEGADWYAGPGVTPSAEPTWGRAPWFTQWEAEHRTIREGVGLMDMSHGEVPGAGADAGSVLDRVSAGAVNGAVETITYTQWLDDDGRIEADLTVTKLAEDDFLVVASDTAHGHALAWLGREVVDLDCRITDVTAEFAHQPAGAAIAGGARLAHGGGPVERGVRVPHRPLDRGGRRARAVRPDHLPGRARLRALRAGRGRPEGVRRAAGHRGGVRPEAGRAQGAGLAPDGEGLPRLRPRHRQHRLPAGGRPRLRARARQARGFRGREAVLARKAANAAAGGMGQRLVQVRVLDPSPLLFHAEVVHRDGVPVGYVRRRRTAGRWGRPSAWRSCRVPASR